MFFSQNSRIQSIAKKRLELVWVDEGYQNNLMHLLMAYHLGILVEIVPKPVSQKGFVVLPRGWVVERSFAWLGRYRCLSKDYEFETQSSESMIYLAMSNLILRPLAKKQARKRSERAFSTPSQTFPYSLKIKLRQFPKHLRR